MTDDRNKLLCKMPTCSKPAKTLGVCRDHWNWLNGRPTQAMMNNSTVTLSAPLALVERIKQMIADRKHLFDVEGDGVDVLLNDCWAMIEALSRPHSPDTLEGAINAEALNRLKALQTASRTLALATGQLITATDGEESLRQIRQAALDAITTTAALLESTH